MSKTSQITAIRSFLPASVLSNDELAAQIGWTANSIFEKTGILERHIVTPNEYTSDLAIGAASALMSDYCINPLSINLLILCTQTPDFLLPSTACLVHSALGLAADCAAFDLNQGCSGYVYALATAHSWIVSGLASRVLVLTADTYSKLIHPNDRSVRTLFGDGASATLLEASDDLGLGSFVFGTDGSGAEHLIVSKGAMRNRSVSTPLDSESLSSTDLHGPDYLYMNGPEVFTFTLQRVPSLVRSILKAGDTDSNCIDFFIFHQANRYLLDHLRNKLGIPAARMPLYLENTGNTVSSSIPLLLEYCFDNQVFTSHQTLLLAGFGVGYSWGGCLLRLPIL